MSITNDFKNLFDDENFLKYLKLNHDIKAIFIGGSRMFDLNSEDSDYDINIVVSDEYFKKQFDSVNTPILYAKYKGHGVHWYYVSPDFKINNKYSNYILDIWQVELYYGLKNKNNIIKIYDEEYFEKYKKSIEQSFNTNLLLIKNKYTSFMISASKTNSNILLANNITKFHYFLYVLSYLITNKKMNVDYIKAIKKIAKFNDRKFSFEQINELDYQTEHSINDMRIMLLELYDYLYIGGLKYDRH